MWYAVAFIVGAWFGIGIIALINIAKDNKN